MQVPAVHFHFIDIVEFLAADVAFFPSAPAVKVIGKAHQVDAKAPHQLSMPFISLKANDTFFNPYIGHIVNPDHWHLRKY